MALSVKHSFQSSKSDGLDTTKVQPSNWNAEHALIAVINSVLGTDGSSTTVKELSCTAAGRAILAAADAAAQKAAMNVAEIPIGGGFHWFDDALPAANGTVEWAWGNGQAVSRTTYSALFALVGTIYGAGDSSTTFNLPDTREAVLLGRSTMGGTSARGLINLSNLATLGALVGEGQHQLTTAELASHSHGAIVNADGSGTHTALTTASGPHSHGVTDPGHGHTQNASTAYLGAGSPASAGTPSVGSIGTLTAGTASNTTGISIDAGGDHAHNVFVQVQNNGSGTAHNNVQPSLVCNYIVRIK